MRQVFFLPVEEFQVAAQITLWLWHSDAVRTLIPLSTISDGHVTKHTKQENNAISKQMHRQLTFCPWHDPALYSKWIWTQIECPVLAGDKRTKCDIRSVWEHTAPCKHTEKRKKPFWENGFILRTVLTLDDINLFLPVVFPALFPEPTVLGQYPYASTSPVSLQSLIVKY